MSERSWKVRSRHISIFAVALAAALLPSAVDAQNVSFWFAQQGDPSGTSIQSMNVELGSPFTVSLWYQTTDSWQHHAVEVLVGFDRAMSWGAGATPLDGEITYVGASNIAFPIVLASNVGGAYSQSTGERPYGAHLALGAALGTTVTAATPTRIGDITLKNEAIPIGSYRDVVMWKAGAESRWSTYALRKSDIRRDVQMASLRINSTSGFTPDYTIPEWKALGDGEQGRLVGVEVTVDVGDSFYVSETDRAAGIRVEKIDPGSAVAAGSTATITGTIATNAHGERYIDASNIQLQAGTATVGPVGVTCKALGGKNWNFNEATGAGQRGASGSGETNNVGLLVRCWGVPGLTGAPDSFTIDDGSGVNVKVQLRSGQSHSWNSGNLPAFVSVTGASGLIKNIDDTYSAVIYVGDFSTDVVTVVP